MDDTDREILSILEEDGRASYTDIAEEIGVSEGTVRNRVERMVENGTIEKFSVETDRRGSKAIVMIRLSTGVDIDELVEKMPEGLQIDEVTGEYDLIVQFKREDNVELNEALDEIREIEGVEETKTYSSLKERRV